MCQGVTGADAFHADDSHDITGLGGFEILALVGVHLQNSADALFGAAGDVIDLVADIEGAGVDAGINEFADMRHRRNLEGHGGQRQVRVGGNGEFFVGELIEGDRSRNV